MTQHTLEHAYAAIQRAIYAEEGLDGSEGERVLALIVDCLGYHPRPRCAVCRKLVRKCAGH